MSTIIEPCDVDVYFAGGLTETITPGPLPTDPVTVTVGVDAAALQIAYDSSCIPAGLPFADFQAQVQAQTDNAANEVYNEIATFNDTWVNTQFGQRVLFLRICIKFSWVQIYINWHI